MAKHREYKVKTARFGCENGLFYGKIKVGIFAIFGDKFIIGCGE